MKTRAIRIHDVGGPEVMQLETVELPALAPGQALVRNEYVGVNFIDTYHRSGLYALPLPHGLGMEGAGIVEHIGPGVTLVKPGDRVAYMSGPAGSYADHKIVDAERLIPLPADITTRQAAAMMLQGMTAEYLIHRTFKVEPGMTVLWHAAAGGVGLIASQWLKHLGATVIGTVGSEKKAAIARAHGCAHTIDYTLEDFVAVVKEITDGRGVPVVFDSVGKSTFDGSLRCLQRRGMFVSFGNASGAPPLFDVLTLSNLGSLFMTRPKLADYTATRDELLTSAGRLFDVVRAGVVNIEITREWPLAEASEVHRALEGRQTIGSVVMKV